MATYYWVGLTATWDNVTILNWANSSGGTPGTGLVPGASDIATFDSNSGSGTVTLNYSPTVSSINFTGFIGTFTAGSNTITSAAWTASSGMTLNASSSTINVTGNNTFTTGGKTYGTVSLSISAGITVSGSGATYNNFTFSNTSGYLSSTLPSMTVNNTLTITGNNNSSQRMKVGGGISTPVTITCNGSVSLTNVDFVGVIGAGSATWSGTSIGNASAGNSNITFTSPVTRYWVHGGNASYDYLTDNRWASTSGGSVGASFPLPQDTALFDANSFPTSGKTVTCTTANVLMANINFTGATNSPTFNPTTPIVYRSMTLISGMTYTISTATSFRSNNTNESDTLTTAGKTFLAINLQMDPTSTLTLQDDLNVGGTLTPVMGTFNANNHNVTMTLLTSNGAATRALTMGSGTWTLSNASDVWNFSGATNVTITPNTSTIKFTNNSSSDKNFYGIGKTYYNFYNNTLGTGKVIFKDGNTFNNIQIDAGRTQQFTAATTTTFTSLTATGTSGAGVITINSPTSATHTLQHNPASLSTRFVSCDYLALDHSIASPAKNFYAGANSTDNGSNTGWIFTVPPAEVVKTISGVTLANSKTMSSVNANITKSISGFI